MKPTLVDKALAYARLLRLSNGPTAVADVWMGYAVAAGELTPASPIVLMTFASLGFYHGGMALNDAMDAERDAVDQRGRPIELGHLKESMAFSVATALLFGGASLAFVSAGAQSLVIAVPLLAAIAAYNSRYKRTAIGPLLMGLCRFLNVQLGAFAAVAAKVDCSLPPKPRWTPVDLTLGFYAAVVIGVYIAGVTWFARDEATESKRVWLASATLVAAAALVLAAVATPYSEPARPFTWAIVALIATRGMVAAILQPTPKNIGRGVGIAIQGLVVIDATLAALYAGPVAGLAILALLPVTMLLARWIPQT